MTTKVDQRSNQSPLRVANSWSAYATGHRNVRYPKNRRPRPRGLEDVSSRLSRDLEQLNCFLEDVEARSGSVKTPGSVNDRGRNISDQIEVSGVESTTGGHRVKELEEQSAKEQLRDSSRTTRTEKTGAADRSLRLELETRWSRKSKLHPTLRKTNGETTMDLRGMHKVSEDSGGMSTVDEDFRGTSEVNRNFRGMTNVNEDSEGMSEVNEDFSRVTNLNDDHKGMKKTTENFRLEAISLETESFGFSESRRDDADTARILSTGTKTPHLGLSQGLKGSGRQTTKLTTDHQSANEHRNQSGENLDNPKTGSGGNFGEQEIHGTDIDVTPILDLANAIYDDDLIRCIPNIHVFEESDATRQQAVQSEGAYCSVALVDAAGVKSVQSSGTAESNEHMIQSSRTTNGSPNRFGVARRSFLINTDSSFMLTRTDSDNKLTKSTDWKDVSDQWIQKVRDREEKAVRQGVARMRSRSEDDEKREKSKPDEWSQKKTKRTEDSEEETEKKKEVEKKGGKEDNERKKEMDSKKDHEKDKKRMEKDRARMEMEDDDVKADVMEMHNRWLGIVSEYAILLASGGSGISKMAAMRSMHSNATQFENEYRLLATKKLLSLTNVQEDSIDADGGDDDDNADNEGDEEAADKGEKAPHEDALESGVEGPQSNTQQQQQQQQQGCLHHPSASNDQAKTRTEAAQRLRASWSSNEHPPQRSSSDIQKTRSDVTLSRSPTKQVTEQDKDGYKDAYQDVSDIGCTRSDKSVAELSCSEKLRYIHPLRQFETDTRAEQRKERHLITESCRQVTSVGHVERAMNAAETSGAKKTSSEERKKIDEGMWSRILCQDRRPEVAGNVDNNVVLFALNSNGPDFRRRSEPPSAAANRHGEGVPAEDHSCCSNLHPINKPSLQVDGSNNGNCNYGNCNYGNSAEKRRSTGITRLPISKRQTERAASRCSSKMAPAVVDASPAAEAETEEPSSASPPRILHSPVTASHPSSAPSVAVIGNNNNSSRGSKEDAQIRGRTLTQNSQSGQQDSCHQTISTDRRSSSQWKRRTSTLGAEAENDYRKQNNEDDVIKNMERVVDAVPLMNRRENILVPLKNGLENNMVPSKNGPKNSMVPSQNGLKNSMVPSQNGPENNTVWAQNGPYEAVAASLREKEKTKKHCLQRSNNNDQLFSGQKKSSRRRSQSHDRNHGLLEDRYFDQGEDRFTGSFDAYSAEPTVGCCDRKKLVLTRTKEPVEMPEIAEKQQEEFRTGRLGPRHVSFPDSTETNGCMKRSYEESGNAGLKTDLDEHDGDDDEDVAEAGGSLDSLCCWSEGDVCEKLLFTESERGTENDATASKEETNAIPDTPVQLIIHEEQHLSRTTADKPTIPDTPLQLPTSSERHQSRMTAPPSPKNRSGVKLFRLVKDAATGLNRNLRTTDIGDFRMYDQRAIIALAVCLIILLFVFVVADYRWTIYHWR